MKRNKYGAVKVKNCLGTFDSKGEYERFLFLTEQQNQGNIKHLDRQMIMRFEFSGKKFKYIADHIYMTKEGTKVLEDYKGYMKGTAWNLFILKWHIVQEKYPEFDYRIVNKPTEEIKQ